MNNVATRFFEVAARFPARPAIVCPGRLGVSYAELADTIHARRSWLRSLGIRPGEVIALALDDPVELAAVILAILAEGAIYTVLDSKLPPARLQFVVQDCGARWVLADAGGAALAASAIESMRQVSVLAIPSGEPADLTATPPMAPSNLAYISYTSGSTGQPKGVVFRHVNILNEVAVHTEALGITAEDRFTWLYPASTVGCTRDLYGALLNGAAIAPVPFRQSGMAALRDWIRDQRLTQYHSVPPIFRELVHSMQPGALLPDLKTVFLAGDRVAWSDVDLQIRHTAPSCRFYTGLGASETSSLYTHWFAKADDTTDRTALPSGHPIPGARVRLEDAEGQEVPPGETGEICVQSQCLAAGYWNLRELTLASFRPALDDSGEHIYKTGDYGTFDTQGRLIYRGRRDQQVKVLGQRIDLSEIDLELRSLPGVREVTVRVIQGPAQAPRIIGYASWQTKPMSEADARLQLAKRLPAAAVPARLIWVDRFPQSGNGKIDYKQLPEPYTDTPEWCITWKPSNDSEARLQAIWQGFFPQWTPARSIASFADLGGDSLKAVELNIQLQSQLGVAITGQEFARGISLPSIAQKLADTRNTRPKPGNIPWETPTVYRERLAAGVQAWLLPPSAQLLADGLGAKLPGPGHCTPLVWLPLMKEDLALAVEASLHQTVYLLQPGLFAIPKDRPSLAPWFRDLCRLLEADHVHRIRCGGFCTGGLAALLLAKEFRSRGGEVEQLILVDAHGSEWTRWINRNIFPRLRLRTRIRRVLNWALRKPTAHVETMVIQKDSPIDFDREPYEGKTVLAMSSETFARRWIMPRWGWTHPTHRNWTTVDIPGTHSGILVSPGRASLLELLSPQKPV